ncbi:MAG: amino acid ABC transporter substrate-binding protein [Candidatus Rokubacteria bacterium]|nr:amino acid ABC transporter substrate-binding protein [Candidatus Rokubacteria bacterium]
MSRNVLKSRGMRWMVTLLVAGVVLALPGSSWLGPGTAQAQAKEFRIGIALSLSGIFSRDATLLKEAYDFWAETVNRQGGIKVKGTGYPIKLIYYDDESSPVKSAQLVERLATADKVDLLQGGFGSSIVFAASAVAEKYKYPYISGAASANPIFERGFKYVFATLNKTFDEVEAAAKVFSLAEPKPKTAAVIGADHLFAKLSAEGFKKFLGEMGIEVVHFEIFPLDLTDYNSLLLKVKRQNPDLLLVGSLFAHSLRVMRAAKEVDYTPKGIAFSYGPTVPDFVKELGKDAEGAIGASEWVAQMPFKDPVFGSAREWREQMLKRWGKEPDYVQAAAAAGAVAQQKAIETLGLAPPLSEKDREAVMEQLHKQEIQTLYGRVKFGADGAVVLKPPIAVQVQGGKLVMVYPTEVGGVRGGTPAYPLKPWKFR